MPNFTHPLRVYYEDTDAGGMVYHANYINFCERARTEWLRDLGFEQDQLKTDEGIIFVVAHLEIDFKMPARFNQLLNVSVELVKARRVTLILQQEIRCQQDNSLCCKVQVKIACVSSTTYKPKPIPTRIVRRLVDAV